MSSTQTAGRPRILWRDGDNLDELLRTVATMPMRDLADLPRADVRGWPEQARDARVDRLCTDPARIKLDGIAALAGVSRDAVAKWRTAALKGKAGVTALPAPIPLEYDPEPGRKPSRDWQVGEVRRWLWVTQRVDSDLYPRDEDGRRPGRSPSGRPPRPRQPGQVGGIPAGQ